MSAPVVVTRDKYDPRNIPRCERCGHGPDLHSTTACEHGQPQVSFGLTTMLRCDCKGWKRDEGWPPPDYIKVPT